MAHAVVVEELLQLDETGDEVGWAPDVFAGGSDQAQRHLQPAPALAQSRMNPLYAAALLKVAVELRQPAPTNLDALIARVLQDVPIDHDAFRGYLQRNFSLLRR